jgi:hypothetical protein
MNHSGGASLRSSDKDETRTERPGYWNRRLFCWCLNKRAKREKSSLDG